MNNIKGILEELGYKLSDNGSHWRTSAVYRGGKNPTALQIYKDTGTWTDFASGDGYFPFVLLVQKTLNTNDPDVLKKYNLEKLVQVKKERKPALLKEEKTYDDSCLKRLLPHYDFYTDKKKNISKETLELYECGLATAGKFYQRFVFPIRDRNKKIIGFSGRTMVDNKVKWLHSGKRNSWVYPFYNIDDVRNSIVDNDVFLIESIGDSLSMYERGIPNHLVTFGLSISPTLTSFLLSIDIDRIIISLNNNPDAFDASIKAFVKLSHFFPLEKLMICPPPAEDYGDVIDGNKMTEFYNDVVSTKPHVNHQTFYSRMKALAKGSAPQLFKKQANKILEYI